MHARGDGPCLPSAGSGRLLVTLQLSPPVAGFLAVCPHIWGRQACLQEHPASKRLQSPGPAPPACLLCWVPLAGGVLGHFLAVGSPPHLPSSGP